MPWPPECGPVRAGHPVSAAPDEIARAVHGVILPGFNGTTAPPWVLDAAAHGLAGVLLFGQNTPSPHAAAALIADLRRAAPELLISSDEEGGDVTRVQQDTGSLLPGACALGAADDVDLTRRSARAQGHLMRAVGVDLPITPVLDVASRPDNPVIGVRSFGPDPTLVSRHGVATVAGLHEAGIGACAKHFPGHGDTDVDSHLELPVLDAPMELLTERDLPPFVAAITAGVDTVMTGHLRALALGTGPASQDSAAADLIREFGHTGTIITDALDMGALHEHPDAGPGTSPADSVALACVRALAGGADLLCLGSTPGRDDEALFRTVRDTILQAVLDGKLDIKRLLASAQRNRNLTATIRRRQEQIPAPELDVALAEVEQIGAEVAAAAVSSTGDVRLHPGDALVDTRTGINLAAGARVRAVTDLLTAQGGLVPLEVDDLPRWRQENPRRRVAVLTRSVHDDVATVLEIEPQAVVLHLGVPGAAPQAPNRVLGHGAGLANAREILSRCAR